jgi:hypothetical protein
VLGQVQVESNGREVVEVDVEMMRATEEREGGGRGSSLSFDVTGPTRRPHRATGVLHVLESLIVRPSLPVRLLDCTSQSRWKCGCMVSGG